MVQRDLLSDLRARGLIAQLSAEEELAEHLAERRTLYCGFDPTADSLHVGSLVPLLALRRFQLAGHRPVALVGGATGLIGDPSFKAQERRLNSPEVVAEWTERLRAQIARFVDLEGGAGLVVNNLEWTGELTALQFLREVGKHFSVNAMIQKEAVRQRLEREGAGISFTEFAYALLQSWDFVQLHRRYRCTLQIGGSDQWGNITSGIDLVRRLERAQVYGLTLPLVTKADGTKFGKTESGTIWLDPARTSPYTFYQFWRNTADADVYRFLRYFTFLPVQEIAELERADAARSGPKEAQVVLAREVTRLVHGAEGLAAAERIAGALFGGSTEALSEADFEALRQDGLPATVLAPADLEKPLTTLLAEAGMAKSGKQVKDALSRGAVLVNGVAVTLEQNTATRKLLAPERARYGRYFLVRLGKKTYHLFTLSPR
ncbi:MAG: tyrosine--tRNA ligase [Porticoccaceae bacterium]|nr:MAG: tyrosine--tRNA ligase [Porticoccaceae bacterium]